MAFQWDQAKERANAQKHGVAFADVGGVFEDPEALTFDDPHPDEDRYVTLGLDFTGRLVVVHWTWREEDIRLISARKANPSERRLYQEGNEHA
ncbi:MAG: BrnT family toxin [Gemmatimonadales bacterium]|nr:BrnT family toxin [Gemmatimonadales bacterium]